MRRFCVFLVLLAAGIFALTSSSLAGTYLPPLGGWTYCYTGDAAVAGTGNFDSLDGTWDHDNGSDQWDGSAIGAGRPGGASALSEPDGTSFLRIQDTGDPRDYGMGDPGSNRKIFFGHSISDDIGGDEAADLLDAGVTLSFRARVPSNNYPPLDDLHPDGGSGVVPYPGNGDTYYVHDGGKGIGIKQAVGGGIGFQFVREEDNDNPGVITTNGLVMNNLNGNNVSGDVDTGEGGTLNLLPLETLLWHEFWINIEADPSNVGTHQVTIWKDGDVSSPDIFLVTAGSGSDYSDMTYLIMEQGATPGSGAVDIDFMCYAPGLHDPRIPEPSTLVMLASVALLGLLAWKRRR